MFRLGILSYWSLLMALERAKENRALLNIHMPEKRCLALTLHMADVGLLLTPFLARVFAHEYSTRRPFLSRMKDL